MPVTRMNLLVTLIKEMRHALNDTILTRRGFLGASIAATVAVTGAVSGCSDEGGFGSATGSSAAQATSQVIVAMNAGSEPACGIRPACCLGVRRACARAAHPVDTHHHRSDLSFVNDLATEYLCSDDGLVWTFTIRDDVVFTDGEPLTAHDVAFTVNAVAKGTTSEAELSMVDQATAVSDTVVEIHLNKPYNALLYTLAVLGIVPEHAYGDGYGANPIGSGRYMLEQWDRGQQAIFRANPDYYGEAPLIERVVVVFMDEDAALAAVRAGQVDIAYTYATHSEQAFDGYELVAYDTVDSRGMSLPTVPTGGTKMDGDAEYPMGNDVTCDLSVRRASTWASTASGHRSRDQRLRRARVQRGRRHAVVER